MKKFKEYALKSFVSAFIVLFNLWLFDPLQVWHKRWFLNFNYSYKTDSRARALSIMKYNLEFDSFLIGSSMLENTSAKEASEAFYNKTNFVNLTASGYKAYEKSLVISKILEVRKDVKNIIYILDSGHWSYHDKDIFNKELRWWVLYDKNPLNDFLVYGNISNFCLGKECMAFYEIQDKHSWMDGFVGGWGLLNWSKNGCNLKCVNDKLKEYKDPKSYVCNDKKHAEKLGKYRLVYQKRLLDVAEKYKNTYFYILSSPYSRLAYHLMDNCEYDTYIDMIKYID
jgi:hypothetical protein